MSWKDHIEQWSAVLKPYLARELHSDIRGPASNKELNKLEELLGSVIPESLRTFMEEESAYIDFWWDLRSDIIPLDVPDRPYCGYIEFNPISLINLNGDRTGFLSGDEPSEIFEQWKNAFVFHGVPNGDAIALDVYQNPDEPPVVYLNHEEPEVQLRLADSFSEYIDACFALGCVGPESWNVRHFVTDKGKPLNSEIDGTATSKLDITCQNSIIFRSFFGLK